MKKYILAAALLAASPAVAQNYSVPSERTGKPVTVRVHHRDCPVVLWPSGRCDPTRGRAAPDAIPPTTTTLVEEFGNSIEKPGDWRERTRFNVPYRGDAYPPKDHVTKYEYTTTSK